jgi:putative transposase
MFERTLDICCELYNAALQERRDAWRIARKSVSCFDQIKQLPEIKTIREDVRGCYSEVLRDPLTRLDRAFDGFFRRVKAGERKAGFPRFRPRSRYNSFTYPREGRNGTLKSGGFCFDNNKLRLSKIGKVKIKLHRPIEGKIKTCIITKSLTGKWFACLSVEFEPTAMPPCADAVGVDCGINTFAHLSTDEQIANPEFLRQEEREIARVERRLSAAKKGTPERAKRRKIAARVYERIANRRRNFAHQESRKLVNKFGIIVFEKLTIQNMVKNHNLAKSIYDAAWGQLIEYTTYKAAWAGRSVIQVDPRNTSQRCSRCRAITKKCLSERIHSCSQCGLAIDRDLNAAINILALGLQSMGASPKSRALSAE